MKYKYLNGTGYIILTMRSKRVIKEYLTEADHKRLMEGYTCAHIEMLRQMEIKEKNIVIVSGPILILVRGPPGSGKSTYAAGLYPDYKKISADDYFGPEYNFDRRKLSTAHTWCNKQVGEWLAEGNNVIVTNTFKAVWELDAYIDKYRRTSKIRVIRIMSQYKNVHGIEDSIIEKYNREYEKYEGEEYKELNKDTNTEISHEHLAITH